MTNVSTARVSKSPAYSANPAENYEKYFVPLIGRPFGVDLVEKAALQSGEAVLDVACGTGVVARLAAQRVAAEGSVAGLDVNPAVLAVARSLPSAIPIKWYETTAESVPLPDNSFDVVFCQFGLQFVADRAAAAKEIRRVVREGGRVYISNPVSNDFFRVLHAATGKYMGEEAAAFVQAVFSLGEPSAMQQLLRAAGFGVVEANIHRRRLMLPAPVDFLWQYIYSTPLVPMLQHVTGAQREELERAVTAGWERWGTAKGMVVDQEILVSEARP